MTNINIFNDTVKIIDKTLSTKSLLSKDSWIKSILIKSLELSIGQNFVIIADYGEEHFYNTVDGKNSTRVNIAQENYLPALAQWLINIDVVLEDRFLTVMKNKLGQYCIVCQNKGRCPTTLYKRCKNAMDVGEYKSYFNDYDGTTKNCNTVVKGKTHLDDNDRKLILQCLINNGLDSYLKPKVMLHKNEEEKKQNKKNA